MSMQFWEVVKIGAILYLFGHAFYLVFYAFDLYQLNPFVKLKPLTIVEQQFIEQIFPVYKEFSTGQKQKCNERIVWFRSKKHFVCYGSIENEEELKLILSATAIIMTLGLRRYRMLRSLNRIIIYPTQYYSRINKKHHLGEFNPKLKAVILSADTIYKGFDNLNDNRNLAIHEFAHALSFEMGRSNSSEARNFQWCLRRISALFSEEDFKVKVAASQYFRAYGLTNLQEFFSVAVENYFETPAIFKNDFPKLFDIIYQMLHMEYEYDKGGSTFRTSLEN